MFRLIIIACATFGFFGLLYNMSDSSHHTAFILANQTFSWAFLWSGVFAGVMWLKVRTK
jgi:hypothetical protein